MSRSSIPLSLTVAFAVTLMLGPFSVDTYLPAFPAMAADLHVSIADIALSISGYIFTLAGSQLIGGALSDQIGRRKVLMSGLGVYLIAAVAIALSNSLPVLLVGRVVQAFGAGWVLVSVPALVRDRVAGQEAAKLFSLIGLIMIVAPGIAPAVGSAILEFSSWRGIFIGLALYAVLLVLIAQFIIFRETPKRPAQPGTAGMLQRYLEVLREKRTLPLVLWQSAGFSAMLVFITHAAFIYQEHFGQSASRFSLLFALNIVAMMGFNVLNRFLLNHVTSLSILKFATTAHVIGGIWLITATVLDWGLPAFVPAVMLTVGSLGASGPNLQSIFLDQFPRSGGSAAALMGATQFGIAGLASGLSTRLPHTLFAVTGTMAAIAMVSVALMLATFRTLSSSPTTAVATD